MQKLSRENGVEICWKSHQQSCRQGWQNEIAISRGICVTVTAATAP